MKQAEAVLAKSRPGIEAFTALLEKAGIELVAAPLRAPVEEALAALNDAVAKAESIVGAADGARLPIAPDLKAISEALTKGKKGVALVTGILATIAKVQSR